MKKIIYLATAFSLMLTLTACNEKSSVSLNSDSGVIVENSDLNSSPTVTCRDAASKVLSSVEFPDMVEVTQAEMLEGIMDFTDFGITEYSVYQQMMSVHLCEVIIVKTDDTAATLEALNRRQSFLIEKLAFYPEQQESANASVTGSKNGYCYLIAHTEAKTAEKELLSFLDKTT